jgi:hypothetical protein
MSKLNIGIITNPKALQAQRRTEEWKGHLHNILTFAGTNTATGDLLGVTGASVGLWREGQLPSGSARALIARMSEDLMHRLRYISAWASYVSCQPVNEAVIAVYEQVDGDSSFDGIPPMELVAREIQAVPGTPHAQAEAVQEIIQATMRWVFCPSGDFLVFITRDQTPLRMLVIHHNTDKLVTSSRGRWTEDPLFRVL